MSTKSSRPGLLERLRNGETVLIAEGYILDLERRGYLAAGPWIPTVVLDEPEVILNIHREYVHAGSEVVEAVTYFGHKTKLESIGRGDDYEPLIRNALKMARQVADETGTLMAGSVCNTYFYTPNDDNSEKIIKKMFREQIEWSIEEGADYIIGETMFDYGEALLALKSIKEFGKGCPAVITMATTPSGITFDGYPIAEACRKLEEEGADVVGLNCERGPKTIMPLMKEIRKVCKGPIACLAVPLRTDENQVTMHNIRDPKTGDIISIEDFSCYVCPRSEIAEYGRQLKEIGVQYVGLCCNNSSHLTRALAEAVGKTPAACKYAPNHQAHIAKPAESFSQYQADKYKTELKI